MRKEKVFLIALATFIVGFCFSLFDFSKGFHATGNADSLSTNTSALIRRDTLRFINSADTSLICGHFSFDDGYYPEYGINYPVYPTPVFNQELGEFYVEPKRKSDAMLRHLKMISNVSWCKEHQITDVTKGSYCFVYIGNRAIPKTVYNEMLALHKKDKAKPYPDLHCRQFQIYDVADVYEDGTNAAIFTIEDDKVYVYIYGGFDWEFLRINYAGWFAPRFATEEDFYYVKDWLSLLPHTRLFKDYYADIDKIFQENIIGMAFKAVLYQTEADYKFIFGQNTPKDYLEETLTYDEECFNLSSHHVRVFRHESNDLYYDDNGKPLTRLLKTRD